jgi:multidrug efflux system membrane fusion protein
MKRALMLFCVLVAAGCERKETAPPRPPAPVLVASVQQKTVPVEVRTIGTVEAFATVELRAQVTGIIEGVHFREGQDVKKGERLFTINAPPFEAALKAAEGNLARDEAKLANALKQSARYEKLLKDGVAPPEEVESVLAEANALDGTVRMDRAAVERARLELQYCTISAPMDGRTGQRIVDAGNTVKANDPPTLVTINQLAPIYVTFTVPEQRLAEVRRFLAAGTLKVRVTTQTDGAHGETGTVDFVNNTVDKLTGTIRLKATFPNTECRLWPGQFVDVVLTLTEEPNVLVVPAEAIQVGQGGQYVYVVKEDKTAEVRLVTVGRTVNGEAVIEKGLQTGETVVTDGQLRLKPGAKVDIKTGLGGKQE